jgi:pimeloyl-ACP methyl ester carboxylesterase
VTRGDESRIFHVYLPRNRRTRGRMPVAVFLHGHTYATGYHVRAGAALERLAERGFAAVGFDQIGFKSRIEAGAAFYDRWPRWSKLGRMAADASVFLTALERLEFAAPDTVLLVGRDIGGTAALVTAALDSRVDGVAAMSAFSPWRTRNRAEDAGEIRCHTTSARIMTCCPGPPFPAR